jgi:hypothetical protein
MMNKMKNQNVKILMSRFQLPILCLAFCFSVALAASPSTPPARNDSAGASALTPSTSGPTITFTNKSGELISDAEVVRTNDGVSLVWEKDGGASGGTVRLEDLPEDLQQRFGYDPVKTAAADELKRQERAQWQQAVIAAQANQVATNQPSNHATNSFPVYTSPRYTPSHRHYIVRRRHAYRRTTSKPPPIKPLSDSRNNDNNVTSFQMWISRWKSRVSLPNRRWTSLNPVCGTSLILPSASLRKCVRVFRIIRKNWSRKFCAPVIKRKS